MDKAVSGDRPGGAGCTVAPCGPRITRICLQSGPTGSIHPPTIDVFLPFIQLFQLAAESPSKHGQKQGGPLVAISLKSEKP